uniref:Claudin n=1 Tax=Astyanax mexicanus TaxID=7994 RepID=A0A3B1JX33_ASTMX
MKYRSVVMYIEIGCFVACVCGWILVCATLPIQYWTYSEVATSVLTNSHTFSNLWKDCMTDLTGMVDCKVFPSLLSLQMYIHLCRATIFTSIVLGFLGAILALIGMKCTKLGGSEITNSKITLAAGMIYLASGLCAMFAFSWYGNKIITEFMDPTHRTKNPIDQEKLVYSTSGAPSPDMLESIQEEEKQPSSPLPSIETEQTEDSEKPLGKAYNKGEYV